MSRVNMNRSLPPDLNYAERSQDRRHLVDHRMVRLRDNGVTELTPT